MAFLSLVIRVGKKHMHKLFFFFCTEKLIKVVLTDAQGKRKKMFLPFMLTTVHTRQRNRMNKRLPSYEETLYAIVLK